MLSKKLYENNLITFDVYENIKEEIDEEISKINIEFKKLLKNKNLVNMKGKGIFDV